MREEPEFAYRDSLQLPEVKGKVLDDFLARGWYRMNRSIFTVSHLFRREAGNFQKVHWLRFEVPAVGAHRSHRGLRKKNRDLEVTLMDPFRPTEELEELYGIYRRSLDFDGYSSVADATFPPQEENPYDTKAWLLKEKGRLIAAGVFDAGENSAASILHFYHPEASARSPGRFLMLLTLDWCRRTGRRFYYPGYVVSGYSKMDYKLFLGPEAAQVYDPCGDSSEALLPGRAPDHTRWVPFREEMLRPRRYTMEHWIRDFHIFFRD